MSKQRPQLTLEDLVEQADQLRQRLALLDMLIASTEGSIKQIETAVNTLSAVATGGETLVPGDTGSHILFRANIADKDHVLLHLGAGIFVEVEREKAADRLLESITELSKRLRQLRQEREETLTRLLQIEAIIRSVVQRQAAAKGKG